MNIPDRSSTLESPGADLGSVSNKYTSEHVKTEILNSDQIKENFQPCSGNLRKESRQELSEDYA